MEFLNEPVDTGSTKFLLICIGLFELILFIVMVQLIGGLEF